MEEIFGYIESILFAEEENGFSIVKIKEPKKKEVTTILGALPGIQPGETIRCKGLWKTHVKHGPQFEVSSFETEVPTDLLGIQRYLESGMIKGIGSAYAERIVKKFGQDTLRVIDQEPQRLLSIEGIGEKRTSTIVRCFQEQRHIRTVMIFLRQHGVTPSFAQKIFKAYGEKSIEKMRENPYRIAQEIFGVGFKSADKIAQNLGVAKNAPERIGSGINHILWELSGEGHTCFPEKPLIEAAIQTLEVTEEEIKKALSSLEHQGHIVKDGQFCWIKPLFLAEVGIAKEVQRLMNALAAIRSVDVKKALEWVQEKVKISFAPQQAEAIGAALQEKMLIITGGPGTGKSTITNALLKITEKLTTKILLAAPTGRAAKRMSEITWKKAFTIHSLLEMDFSKGGFKKGRDNPLQCDLLIVDEASMIDTQLMYSLLKAIPSTARVIFVGDIDQLPSVGPGSVLRDMIDSKTIPVITLSEIFRQAKGSHIITNAHRINKGEFPWLGGEKDFRFIEEEDPEKIQQILVRLVTKELPEFHPLEGIQILCPMKKGVIGTETLNLLLQEALSPSMYPLMRMGKRFHKGDKVMQIRNNYEKGIFNGDIGKIERIDLVEQTLQVLFDAREVNYEFSELDELVLAYAVSVHKYQGSECPCVLLPMHTSHFKLLHRNLFYTAVTRGKKRVILVGSKKAIGIAVRTEDSKKRHTGLKAQLQGFITK